jgi:hypothetical protein
MGHIKEPKGIDFIIKSEPLTEAISEFIRKDRAKQLAKVNLQKKISSKKKHLVDK